MPNEFILIVILAAVVLLLFLTFISRYKRCPSNKILVIYGKTGGGTAAKCVHGGAAFVLPLLQDYEIPRPRTLCRTHRPGQRAFTGKHPRIRAHHSHSSHLQSARRHAKRGHPPPGPVSRSNSEPGTGHHPRSDARSHCNYANRRNQSGPTGIHDQSK